MGLKAALRMMGRADVADERVRAYFAQYDVDGNGTLDFEEFKGLARQLDADEHAGDAELAWDGDEYDLTDDADYDENGAACYDELYPLSKFACGFCGDPPPPAP